MGLRGECGVLCETSLREDAQLAPRLRLGSVRSASHLVREGGRTQNLRVLLVIFHHLSDTYPSGATIISSLRN
jgi:hypothetical protein